MDAFEMELFDRIDVRDPKTWPRYSVLAKHYEEKAVEAEWNGRTEEAETFFRRAQEYREKVETDNDLYVPF